MFPSIFILFVIVLFKKYKFLAQVREIEPLTTMRIIYGDILYESRLYNHHCQQSFPGFSLLDPSSYISIKTMRRMTSVVRVT